MQCKDPNDWTPPTTIGQPQLLLDNFHPQHAHGTHLEVPGLGIVVHQLLAETRTFAQHKLAALARGAKEHAVRVQEVHELLPKTVAPLDRRRPAHLPKHSVRNGRPCPHIGEEVLPRESGSQRARPALLQRPRECSGPAHSLAHSHGGGRCKDRPHVTFSRGGKRPGSAILEQHTAHLPRPAAAAAAAAAKV